MDNSPMLIHVFHSMFFIEVYMMSPRLPSHTTNSSVVQTLSNKKRSCILSILITNGQLNYHIQAFTCDEILLIFDSSN